MVGIFTGWFPGQDFDVRGSQGLEIRLSLDVFFSERQVWDFSFRVEQVSHLLVGFSRFREVRILTGWLAGNDFEVTSTHR